MKTATGIACHHCSRPLVIGHRVYTLSWGQVEAEDGEYSGHSPDDEEVYCSLDCLRAKL